MDQVLVAIGREYGSGGHEIGEKLSKKLGIGFYDRNMLDEMFAHKSNAELEKYEERKSLPFTTRHIRGYTNSIEENLAEAQFDFIRGKAIMGDSFVIVGRCGESVLKDFDGLVSIFVIDDLMHKIERIRDMFGLDEKAAFNKISRHDKARKQYHNMYADYKWGDSRGYDLCINSGRFGVDGTVDFLYEYVNRCKEAYDKN